MLIRECRIGDEADLRAVFLSAVRDVASRDYTPEQIEAWATRSLDLVAWARRIQSIKPFVVEFEGMPIAYADVQLNGYITHFFVSGRYPRRGVGTLLMNHLHAVASERGIDVLTSDVSRTAQPFFRRFGFALIEQRSPVLGGVVVPNALMRKIMRTDGASLLVERKGTTVDSGALSDGPAATNDAPALSDEPTHSGDAPAALSDRPTLPGDGPASPIGPRGAVRRAVVSDLDALMRLYAEIRPEQASPEADDALHRAWLAMLSNPSILVAVIDAVDLSRDDLAATAMVAIVPSVAKGPAPFGVIEHVVTARASRGQGMADRVMRFVIDHAWREGCYKVMLLSGAQRDGAHRLYDRLGFDGDAERGFVLKRPG